MTVPENSLLDKYEWLKCGQYEQEIIYMPGGIIIELLPAVKTVYLMWLVVDIFWQDLI